MILGELLDRRTVLVPLPAADVRDATRQLADALVAAGMIAEPERFRTLLEDQWPEDIVAIGGRVLLPHFRTNAAARVAVALGVAAAPVTREGDAARGARVVVLVVAPTTEASSYLRAMAAVAQALSSDETLEALHRCGTPDEVMALVGLHNAPVPADVTVRDVMTSGVTTVTPDMTLREAAHVMLTRGVSTMPVVGPSREVLGALTDLHLMRYLLPGVVSALSTGQVRAVKRRRSKESPLDAEAVCVRDVMDRSVLCLAEEQSIADVAALMLSKELDRFPVTRDGALVGFLTRSDIVRKLLGA